MTVIVLGSINMDLVAHTPRLPQPGETLMGTEFFTTPGGKGANQAVAVARLGVPTQLISRVGDDAFGRELLAGLEAFGVDIQGVQIQPAIHSGVAIISVAGNGENQIIGIPGANGCLDATDVERMEGLLPQAKALLLQLEIPVSVVKAAAIAARKAGVQVILDPAPVPPDAIADLYPLVDILLPNEVEATQLVGFSVHNPDSAAKAATHLQQQGAHTVIVKLGAQGVFCATPETHFFVPAFPVEAVDTVAAGDAFAGGLTTALVSGLPLPQAIVWGTAAGALATTQIGAQSAMCDRPTFEAFLRVNTSTMEVEAENDIPRHSHWDIPI